MAELKAVAREIERLRESLHKLVMEKQGQFLDEEVTRLSQRLDVLIVQYQKETRCRVYKERKCTANM